MAIQCSVAQCGNYGKLTGCGGLRPPLAPCETETHSDIRTYSDIRTLSLLKQKIASSCYIRLGKNPKIFHSECPNKSENPKNSKEIVTPQFENSEQTKNSEKIGPK